jgi:hypothetical protein
VIASSECSDLAELEESRATVSTISLPMVSYALLFCHRLGPFLFFARYGSSHLAHLSPPIYAARGFFDQTSAVANMGNLISCRPLPGNGRAQNHPRPLLCPGIGPFPFLPFDKI